MELVLENEISNAHLTCGMSVLTVFVAQLYFHAATLISRKAEKKVNIVRNEIIITMTGIAIQLLRKAFDAPTKPSSLRALQVVIEP